jgi:NAD(P)-dependent dehydrogenase (short-subunit alcohol dehydrogenase family)
MRRLRVALVGATGLIGRAVATALEAHNAVLEVVSGSRTAGVRVDIGDAASIERFLEAAGLIDVVVCCAGRPRWGSMVDLAESAYLGSLHEKLMGQIMLTKLAVPHLRDGGVVVLTAGLLARHPIMGSTAAATVNAALEGFVRAAALEMPRGCRVVVVSPGWVGEPTTDARPRTPASEVAHAYIEAIVGDANGTAISVGRM